VVRDGFIFVERDFPTSEKKLFKSLHCFWHSEPSKSLLFCWDLYIIAIISLTSFHVFFYIMMAFLESLFIVVLFGDFFQVDKLISVSFALFNNIWVVCCQLLSVEQVFPMFLVLRATFT